VSEVIVNLGCGKTRIPGSIGVDRVAIPGSVDVVHNLNVTPYPFPDESVDEVHFYHVLEHLDDPVAKLEEIHRILKPGGVLHMRVPHFSSSGAFTDITHKRPFSYYSFDCFEEGSYHSFYTTRRFKIVDRAIKYLGLYPNEGVYARYIHPNQCPALARPFVRALNWLIARSPMLFERLWCYWVGGATEVVITMRKEKS
jgi:SAM-dependent methyltransferase